MGPLQKGYENWFTVEGGELKHINRKGCFKHSESAGKKEETHRKCKSVKCWVDFYSPGGGVDVNVCWDQS